MNIEASTIKKIKVAIILLLSVVAISLIGKTLQVNVFAPTTRKLPIYSVDTKEKRICITFDVNWGDDKTEEILEILDKYNAKATFYIIGLWCEDFPEKVKEISRRGHEIGNHSNKHADYTKLTKNEIIADVEKANAKILGLTGELPKTFRFPSGSYNDEAVQTIEELGLRSIQWDVDSVDWKANGADIEYNRVISKAKEGSIVLFHNDGKYTPENLERILNKYTAEGYDFITISQLVYEENYYLDHTGKQILK